MSQESQEDLSQAIDRYVAEQYLMESGTMPTTSIDTLLKYAYSQPGVRGCRLEFSGSAEEPVLTYVVSVARLKLLRLFNFLKEGGTLSKILALAVLRLSGVNPTIEPLVKDLAKRYLPEKYDVQVRMEPAPVDFHYLMMSAGNYADRLAGLVTSERLLRLAVVVAIALACLKYLR